MKRKIFEIYVDKICEIFQINREDIFTKNKKQESVAPRYFLYYMCKDRDIGVCLIQEYLRDNMYDVPHSTVVYGINQMKKRLRGDKDYRAYRKMLRECEIV